MNYASAVFAGFALVSVIWYIISGRKNFSGPPVKVDESPEQMGQVAVFGGVGEELGRVVTEGEKTLNGSANGRDKH